jgi:hypothetical protein
MLGVGFEPTIPVFERAKTVHALDRAATVIGITDLHALQITTVPAKPFSSLLCLNQPFPDKGF